VRSAARFAPPRVAIVLELEASPRVEWTASTIEDLERLHAWLDTHDQLAELVGRALLLSPAFLAALFEATE
jgi:hypothetical protein